MLSIHKRFRLIEALRDRIYDTFVGWKRKEEAALEYYFIIENVDRYRSIFIGVA